MGEKLWQIAVYVKICTKFRNLLDLLLVDLFCQGVGLNKCSKSIRERHV